MSLTRAEATEAFKEALEWANRRNIFSGGGGSSGSSAPTAPSSSGFSDSVKKETTAAAGAFVGLGKAGLDVSQQLLIGGARISDATGALSKNLQGLDKDGSILGKTLEFVSSGAHKLGVNIDQNVDLWRRLSDSGASFGNDIIAMKEQASNARMTLEEMSEVVRVNTTNLAGLGPTVSQSVAAFSRVSKEMYDSGAGEQLRAMGYTTKELNDVLAVSLSNRKISDLRDEAGRKKAYESAASLATEMDAVAKITGQSKQQQLDELRRREADGQRQAAIDSAIAKGGENAKAAFDILETTSKAGGTTFQKLAQDIAAMKRPSEGMEEAYAALGPETQKLLQRAGEAARAGNEAEAKRLTEQALEARANFQKTETYRTLAAQGLKTFSDQYGEGGAFRKSMDAAGGSVEGLKKSVKDAQAGLEVDPTTGERVSKDATKAITEFAVNVESRGRDVTKALTDQLIVPLTEKIGPKLKVVSDKLSDPKFVTGFEKDIKTGRVGQEAKSTILDATTNKEISGLINSNDRNAGEVRKLLQLLQSDATRDKTTSKLESLAREKGQDVSTFINSAMANKGAGVAALNKQLESALSPEDLKKMQTERADIEKKREASKNSVLGRNAAADISMDRGTTMGEGLGKAIGEIGLFINKPGKVEVTNFGELPRRAEGGFVNKPELSIIGEAGPEFVLNQPQMKSLITGLSSKNLELMSQGIDISKISKEISTTISATPGTSSAVDPQRTQPSMSNISFGPNGMPTFRQAEAAKESIGTKSPAEIAAKKEAEQAVREAKVEKLKPENSTPAAVTTKSSTLDDVTKELIRLNKLMSQFVDDHKEIGTKQIRATRSSGSANINERI